MNSRERMAAAMAGRKGDRVPVMCQLALGHYFLNTDFAPYDIWFDSEVFADALVQMQQRYRFDGILVNVPGRPDGALGDVARIDKTAGRRAARVEEWGDHVLPVGRQPVPHDGGRRACAAGRFRHDRPRPPRSAGRPDRLHVGGVSRPPARRQS